VRDIAHPGLPVPVMTPTPADASLSRHHAARGDNVVEIVHKDTPAPAAALVNPLERAKAARRQAIADAASTSKAAKAAVATSAARSAEANAAIVARIGAEVALATARTKRDAAARAMDEAADMKAIERARDTLLQAEAKITEAERTVDQARAVEATKTPEAFAAAKTAWTAERAGDEAAARLKSTERNTEPISIFVSRKAGRIFVRQAWAPIHEAPVTFKESELPLGTHTYLAAASDETGGRLRWISVSLPPSRPVPPRGETRRDGQAASPASLSAAPAAHQPETAASVLERFELAEETRRFIEDRLWTGASLIVSDEGISPETGATTDFIVVTR
jgi:hypothetical protein